MTRVILVVAALFFVALFLVLPLVAVFAQAFAHGWRIYIDAIRAPRLTGISTSKAN